MKFEAGLNPILQAPMPAAPISTLKRGDERIALFAMPALNAGRAEIMGTVMEESRKLRDLRREILGEQ